MNELNDNKNQDSKSCNQDQDNSYMTVLMNTHG